MSEGAPRARPRRWAFPLLLVLCSGAASLLAMELLVRLLSDEGESLLAKDSRFGQTYTPGLSVRRLIPEAGREVALRFNREGFRGADVRLGKPAGTRRAVVLGDSFVAGVGVEESAHAVTLLESRLRERTRGPWQALNFGVSGAGTTQAILIYELVARRYQPDLVILGFFHGNDLADNLLDPARQPRLVLGAGGELVLERPAALRDAVEGWIHGHSQLFVWLLNKKWQLRERRRVSSGAPAARWQVLDARPEGDVEDAWRVTDAMVARLAADVRRDGAALLVAGLPAHEQVIERLFEEAARTMPAERSARLDRAYPDRRLGEICAARGIPYLALAPAFAADRDPSRLFLGADGAGHWSEAGHALVAGALAEAIAAARTTPLPEGAP